MKTISSWKDLRPFGIDLLTGEACALIYRGLVDLTKRGKKIVCKLFKLPEGAAFEEQWNHGSDEDPHIASIMMPYDLWLSLAIFALIDDGACEVHWVQYGNEQQVTGLYSEEDVGRMGYGYEHQFFKGIRVFRVKAVPGRTSPDGLTNVHQASGRTA